MKTPEAVPRINEARFGALARTELFIGRVVTGAAVGEAVGAGLDKLDLSPIHSSPGNTAVAAVGLGLIYAIKNWRNPR